MTEVNHRRHLKRCLMCKRKKILGQHGKCLDCRYVLTTQRMSDVEGYRERRKERKRRKGTKTVSYDTTLETLSCRHSADPGN